MAVITHKGQIIGNGGGYTKSEVDSMIGNLTNLTTDAKTNLVAAINEVDSHTDTIINDKEPYVSRTARDGLVKLSLIGGTVAWNQLVNTNLTCTLNKSTNRTVNVTTSRRSQINHIYLLSANITNDTTLYGLCFQYGSGTKILGKGVGLQCKLFVSNDTSPLNIYMFINLSDNENSTLTFNDVNLTDLTQMFGTTIADYVYSLEQSVEGSGLAWLQSYGFFTEDYYAYDAGSLQSVCTSGRKITALDGTVRNYPIENVELRGLFKLDANNKLYCDGDVYKSSGAVTRKYGIVDLGTLDWNYSNSEGLTFVTINDLKVPTNNLICFKYLTANYSISSSQMVDKTIKSYATNEVHRLYLKDSSLASKTTEEIQALLSGVYLIYEFAEEATFSADPYINPQRSEGTEEFVDGLTRDVMIPVGNESTYYLSEVLPSAADYTDGVAEDVERDITNTQSLIAPILMSLVAPTDGLSAGEQFVYNGLLYKVTVAIASGGTIIIDGNCKLADNVTNQILLLTSELNKLKNATRRTQRNITTDLANLPTAVAEQNLEKYGYTIGDYFIGNSGYTYFLADMNTFRGAQSNRAVVNQNHISIVVKTGASSKWNETNDTSTGYSGSVLHSYLSGTVLDNIKSDMIALFGGTTGLEHLLSHKLLWTTATSSYGWSADAQYISALTEPQVCGTAVWSINGYQTGEAWKHLELFKKFSYMEILGWIWFLLRSIHSSSEACRASEVGDMSYTVVRDSGGVVGLIIFK